MPERLRKRAKIALNLPQIPRESLIVFVGGVTFILVLIHILLFGVLILQKTRSTSLSRNLQRISGPKQEAEKVKSEISELENRMHSFEQVTDKNTKVLWGQKLNQISNFIPSGVWLNKLRYSMDKFVIEGSAISKKGEEMVLVGKFASSIKNEPVFNRDFQDIELASINRDLIKTIEVANFVITGRLKGLPKK